MGNQNNNLNKTNSNIENNGGNGAPPNPINNQNDNENTIKGDNSPNNQNNEINENGNNENKINEEIKSEENNEQNKMNSENDNGDILNSNENSDCPVPASDLNKYEKHFSFNGLMSKIKETAKKAGLKAIYMALLLYYALESQTISTMDKAIIYGALGYFISPIDVIPDILPIIGLSDDIAVLAWAFNRIKHNVTDLTREKAKTKLKIWFGNFDEKKIDDL